MRKGSIATKAAKTMSKVEEAARTMVATRVEMMVGLEVVVGAERALRGGEAWGLSRGGGGGATNSWMTGAPVTALHLIEGGTTLLS